MGQRGNFLLFNIKHKHLWASLWYSSRQTKYQLSSQKNLLIKDLIQTLIHFNWQQIWVWYNYIKIRRYTNQTYRNLIFKRNLASFMLQVKVYQLTQYYLITCFIINFEQLTYSAMYKYLLILKYFTILLKPSQFKTYLNF
jgi:hypothetical protein